MVNVLRQENVNVMMVLKDMTVVIVLTYLITLKIGECPSGSLFPGGTLRVCSGNGDCNRETGVCNCYEGFEGDNCANIGCVNECSGHGVCVSSAYATYVLDNNYPYYKSGANNQAATPNIYVCVCDNEYTGYDCSESIYYLFIIK